MVDMHLLKVRIAKAFTASSIGKLIALAYMNEIPCRGLRFNTRDSLVHPSTKASLFWGFYESAEIRFVNAYLPRFADVIELGSSIGVVSSFIRKRVATEHKLICVEADNRLTKSWLSNLRLNRCDHNAFIINRAIAYTHQPGENAFFVAGLKNTDGKMGSGRKTDTQIVVRCSRLSEILSEHAIKDFSLVCDIEGNEAELIHHEPDTLNRCHFAIMELHESLVDGYRIGVKEMLRLLTEDLGFSLVDRNGPVVCLTK